MCEQERFPTIQEEGGWEDEEGVEWKVEEHEEGLGWRVDKIEKERNIRKEWEEEAARLEKWFEGEESENVESKRTVEDRHEDREGSDDIGVIVRGKKSRNQKARRG